MVILNGPSYKSRFGYLRIASGMSEIFKIKGLPHQLYTEPVMKHKQIKVKKLGTYFCENGEANQKIYERKWVINFNRRNCIYLENVTK